MLFRQEMTRSCFVHCSFGSLVLKFPHLQLALESFLYCFGTRLLQLDAYGLALFVIYYLYFPIQ